MDKHLEVLRWELGQSLDGLDDRQTQLRPAGGPERWSIQQIAGHLRLTYIATAEAMNARTAKGTPTKGRPSAIQYAAQFTLIRIGYFPRGRKAPERVTAPQDEIAMSGNALIADLSATLSIMDTQIESAAAIFGCKRRVISHMVLGPLSIDQWRKFHLVHGRHHIRQIAAVRRENGI